MKKLLAICLSVFMVISLMPAVFAEDVAEDTTEASAISIPATGETYIEAEDYTAYQYASDGTNYAASTVSVGTGSYHGGSAVKHTYQPGASKKSKAYVEIPISVETEGDYLVTLNTIHISLSDTTVTIDGAKVLAVTGIGGSNQAQAFANAIGKIHLTPGAKTLKIASAKTSTSSSYHFIYWDYIKFEPLPAVTTVPAEGGKIEAENYPVYDGKAATYRNRIATGDSYSGGAYIANYYTSANNASTYVEIPFKVAESGVYSLKAKIYHINTASAVRSKYTIAQNGTVISANPITKPSSSKWEEVAISARSYTAGTTYTIKINCGVDNGYSALGADYIELVPFVSGSVEVPESGELTVQAESYKTVLAHRVKKADSTISRSVLTGTSKTLSDITYLHAGAQDANQTTGTTATWILDFTVPADGNYRIITSHAGRVKDYNAGANAYVDGTQILNDTTQITYANLAMSIDAKTVHLTAGKHTYKYEALFTPNNYYMFLDYVSFKLLDMPVDLSETETVRIEAEDVSLKCESTCAVTPTIKYTNSNATVEFTSVHHFPVYTDFVVNAPVAGNYTFSAYVNKPGTKGNLSLKVNGATVTGLEDNNETGWELKTVTIPLNEGENTVTVRVAAVSGYSNFGLDYVEFTKVEEAPVITPDSVRYASDVATVYVNFADAGKAIVAFYGADGALVGITSADVDANGVIETTVTCAAEPTVCKAFVWDGFANATPIGVHKTIAITK